MKIDLYLNKKEKISKNFEKIINECVIWYPRSINDAVEQLQALGLPAKEDNIINIGNAGGVTIKSKVEQVAAAGRVLNKRIKRLNNNMPLEAYNYYIDNADLFFSDITDSEIFEELDFTEEIINKNSEKFKEIRKEYFNKMYDLW